MISAVKLFASSESLLGEGPLWHQGRQSLFWLDILQLYLYEKKYPGNDEKYDRRWKLPEMASSMAVDANNPDHLWMITDRSFGYFSLDSGIYQPSLQLEIGEEMRANDGGVSPGGYFWFGTMERQPGGLHGSVFSISPRGELYEHLTGIGIPNTFCWSVDGSTFYLSDSFRQCMFAYKYTGESIENANASPFLNLSGTPATPDGGAITSAGNIWNSQWDGSRVVCYSSNGKELNHLELSVPRPTSCCFGGPENRHLFVTSAREGLDEAELSRSPLSGSVFIAELQEAGQPLTPFSMR